MKTILPYLITDIHNIYIMCLNVSSDYERIHHFCLQINYFIININYTRNEEDKYIYKRRKYNESSDKLSNTKCQIF